MEYQDQILVEELKQATEDLNQSSHTRAESAKETRMRLDEYFDKLALYSSGAFSFSIGFLSLVASFNRAVALTKVGFLLPNVFWMYLSLIFFALAVLAVFLSKRFDARYVSQFGFTSYLEGETKYSETRLKVFPKLKDQVTFVGGGNLQDQIRIAKDNHKLFSTEASRSRKKRDLYHHFVTWTRKLAEISALIGSALHMLFSIQLIQSLVW